MRCLLRCALLVAALCAMANPVFAEPTRPPNVGSRVDNLCRQGPPTKSHATAAHWKAQLDRTTAVYSVKHLRRACDLLTAFVRDHQILLAEKKVAEPIMAIGVDLRMQALEPIYRRYPDLRDKDVGGEETSYGWIGRTTARRLLRVLSTASTRFIGDAGKIVEPVAAGDLEKVLKQVADVGAEIINFVNAPVFKHHPDLWQAEFRSAADKLLSRSAESDAAYRKSAPPPGTVRLTAEASSFVRKFFAESRRYFGKDDHVAIILWVLERRSKGPDDAAWSKEGPGLQFGALSRRQVPPDVIQTIDGLKIVLSAPDPSTFVGKVIDVKEGNFVFKGN